MRYSVFLPSFIDGKLTEGESIYYNENEIEEKILEYEEELRKQNELKKILENITEDKTEMVKEFYENKAPKEWLEALEPLGTDTNKSFLEEAPYLIAVFEKK